MADPAKPIVSPRLLPGVIRTKWSREALNTSVTVGAAQLSARAGSGEDAGKEEEGEEAKRGGHLAEA